MQSKKKLAFVAAISGAGAAHDTKTETGKTLVASDAKVKADRSSMSCLGAHQPCALRCVCSVH